jgi:hypothetical protein
MIYRSERTGGPLVPARKTKDSQKAQSQRFIEAAREAEASEDEAVFDETLKRIAKAKPSPTSKDKPPST